MCSPIVLMLLAAPPFLALGPPVGWCVSFEEVVVCESKTGEGWIEDLEVQAAVPSDNHRQRLSDLRLIPASGRLVRDAHGNLLACWRVPRLEAGEERRFGWTCLAETRSVEHRLTSADLRGRHHIPESIRERYLAHGVKYSLDDPRLQALARRLAQEAANDLELVFLINEFVRAELTYRNDGVWDDAAKVLRNGHGSCSEYSFLFNALCRLNGLPARYVGATACRGPESFYEDRLFHRWSEVYLPGHGWFPVDVSRNDGEDGQPVNACFGRLPENVLVLGRGDGGEDQPLGWGYVVSLEGNPQGDGQLAGRARFRWTGGERSSREEPRPER